MTLLRIPVLIVALSTCAGRSTVEPEPTPLSDIQKKSVASTIRQRISGLESCYEQALRSNAGLKGKMVFTLEINGSGRVEDITIEEYGIDDSSLRACTEAMISTWRFIAVGESHEVTFSVRFTG
jgi:hypothetical protein